MAWHHAKNYLAHLELMCEGPSAPSPRAKIVEMKQLAHAAEARLANQ